MLPSASAVLLLLSVCLSALPPVRSDVPLTASWQSNGLQAPFLAQAVYSPGCDSTYQAGSAAVSAAYWGGNSNQYSPGSWTSASYSAPSGSPLSPSWLNFSLQSAALPSGLASFGLFQSQASTLVAWGGTTPTGPSGLPAANNSVFLSTDAGRSWTQVRQQTPFAPRYNFSYTAAVAEAGSSVKVGFAYGGYGADGALLGECWTVNASGQANQTCSHLSSGLPVRASPGLVSLLNGGFGEILVLAGGRRGNARNTSYTYLNDVWTSVDLGVNWEQVTDAAPWTPRYGHSIWSGQQQDVFIYGGNGAGVGFAELPLTDLWWGDDVGTAWTLLTPSNAAFAPAAAASIAGCHMSAVITAATASSGAVLDFFHLASTAGLGAQPRNYSAVLQVRYNNPPN